MHRRALLSTLAAGAGWTSQRFVRGQDGGGEGPSPYEPLGQVAVDGVRELALDEAGDVAYAAAEDGIATLDVSDPTAPRVLAERRDLLADELGGPIDQVWDVWPDGDRLLAVGPAESPDEEPAVRAALLFDVSDPGDPALLDARRTSHPIHNCAFADGIAYLTANYANRHELAVFDASDDVLTRLGGWRLPDVQPDWTEVPAALWQLHDVTVRGDVAVLAHWDAGTWLLDVSDPAEPTALGHVAQHDAGALADVEDVTGELFTPPGNDHFAELGPDGDVLAVGREAWQVQREGCLEGGPGGVDLYDASDPSSIEHLSRIPAPKSYRNTRTAPFTTSHNFELTGDRLYTSWYFGGVKVHDVSDPAAPEEIAWWRRPDETGFWTARLAAPGEYFVASSAHEVAGFDESVQGRVYCFPDAPGEQPDAPSLLERPPGHELQPRCEVETLARQFRASRDGDG